MKYTIALLAGDGIGPEVVNEAVKVSEAIAKKFNHEIKKIFRTYSLTVPQRKK